MTHTSVGVIKEKASRQGETWEGFGKELRLTIIILKWELKDSTVWTGRNGCGGRRGTISRGWG